MDRDSIIRDFEDYIDKYQLDYSEIYVGITNDVERRLFQEHQVPKDHYWWIYSPTDNNDIAKKVEQYFISKGCQEALVVVMIHPTSYMLIRHRQ